MGRSLADKEAALAELEAQLSDTQMVMVIDYSTLSVAEITKLRRQLRPTGTVCKVAKNTLMRKAIASHEQWQPMEQFLKGSSACLLVKEDIAGAIKAYQGFQKETKKTELRGGVLEGRALTQADLKAIADLPSREVLLAQIAGAINGVATKLAVGIKEVPQSLGRAIKAIHEKEAA
ncbi:50S ribosomal protein L10 [Pseudanabaena sp. PCC 6802]|uniref:50S ribosomal protein L10 n=1 Tax=Pseudanabaena sp. PCC 6802 TaxID=118173 RepID=UPI00034C6338|nr:50S ribosomal protein L10 [Pseudanabaena sp. PCC 6802]